MNVGGHNTPRGKQTTDRVVRIGHLCYSIGSLKIYAFYAAVFTLVKINKIYFKSDYKWTYRDGLHIVGKCPQFRRGHNAGSAPSCHTEKKHNKWKTLRKRKSTKRLHGSAMLDKAHHFSVCQVSSDSENGPDKFSSSDHIGICRLHGTFVTNVCTTW